MVTHVQEVAEESDISQCMIAQLLCCKMLSWICCIVLYRALKRSIEFTLHPCLSYSFP